VIARLSDRVAAVGKCEIQNTRIASESLSGRVLTFPPYSEVSDERPDPGIVKARQASTGSWGYKNQGCGDRLVSIPLC
jgi:hypothetical protein